MDHSTDILDQLEAAVSAEYAAQRGSWPNIPSTHDYAKHAEALGLTVQEICDSGGSTGAYYTVIALYDVEYIFGAQPLALVFTDFAKSVDVTWMARFDRSG